MAAKRASKGAGPKIPAEARRVGNRLTPDEEARQNLAGERLGRQSIGIHDFFRGTAPVDAAGNLTTDAELAAQAEGRAKAKRPSDRPKKGPDGRLYCPFEVVIDTREQRPYAFADITADPEHGGGPLVVPTRKIALRWGDYSVMGMPQCGVERKSKEDLYSSIAQRRENFIQRLEFAALNLAWAAVVVEATWEDAFANPPSFTQFNPLSLVRTIDAWMQRYPTVHWVWAAGREVAELRTFWLLKRFWEDHREWGEVRELAGEGIGSEGVQR